jgi:hypothetical protein
MWMLRGASAIHGAKLEETNRIPYNPAVIANVKV